MKYVFHTKPNKKRFFYFYFFFISQAAVLAQLSWLLTARCHLQSHRPDLAAQLTRREAATIRAVRLKKKPKITRKFHFSFR